jgi:hypothetical protein
MSINHIMVTNFVYDIQRKTEKTPQAGEVFSSRKI